MSVIQIRQFIYLKVYGRIANHSSTQFNHKVTFSNTQAHKPFCIQFTWEWRSWFEYSIYAICIQIKNMKIIHAKTLNAIKSSFRFIYACMIYGMQQVSWSCRERECHETIINIFISGTVSGSARSICSMQVDAVMISDSIGVYVLWWVHRKLILFILWRGYFIYHSRCISDTPCCLCRRQGEKMYYAIFMHTSGGMDK